MDEGGKFLCPLPIYEVRWLALAAPKTPPSLPSATLWHNPPFEG